MRNVKIRDLFVNRFVLKNRKYCENLKFIPSDLQPINDSKSMNHKGSTNKKKQHRQGQSPYLAIRQRKEKEYFYRSGQITRACVYGNPIIFFDLEQ